MKRIVFLVIATLMVLGLVLPGCGGEGEGETPRARPLVAGQISIAVTGPMSDVQGINHWQGAIQAATAINATGITLNSTPHYVKLVKVDTNEVLGLPDEGVTALSAVIDTVDFVVGGFRTESVSAYRTVAMDAKVIMMNCGAATLRLQKSVNENYATYKYWFKATPYNEIFLVTSCFKLTASAVGAYVTTLMTLKYGPPYLNFTDPGYAFAPPPPLGPGTALRVVIVAESLEWCAAMVTAAQAKLPTLLTKKGINMTVVGTYKWSDKATTTDIQADMAAIKALKPHVIFTIFSGPVGKSFSKLRYDTNMTSLCVGINVEGQQQGIVTYTGGGCQYDMMLDTWGWGVNQSTKTGQFFSDYWAAKSDYPLYTAATFDAIYSLKASIEATDSCDPAVMIPNMEGSALEGAGTPLTKLFPSGALLAPGTWALNSTQVTGLYPFLSNFTVPGPLSGTTYGSFCATDIQPWTWNASHWTTTGGFCAHDTVYGPGLQTGVGTQWQNVSGTLRKVGWWPMILDPLLPPGGDGTNPNAVIAALPASTQAYLYWLGVIDNYGYWNFKYPGTSNVTIPYTWWLGVTVP